MPFTTFNLFHDRTFRNRNTTSFPDQSKADATQVEPFKCPDGTYGADCACFEDDAAYFGNNERVGNENPQPSRHACQQSCQHHPSCKFWTWGKAEPTGPCYLKTKRDNVGYNLTSYVSGNKFCRLPEADDEGSRNRNRQPRANSSTIYINGPTPVSFCLFSVFPNKQYNFPANECEKMSIQNTASGFEPTTSQT